MRRLAPSKSVSQVAILLLLLSSSCALANDGARRSGYAGKVLRHKSVHSEDAEPWKMAMLPDNSGSGSDSSSSRSKGGAGILKVGYEDGDKWTVEETIVSIINHQEVDDDLELRRRSPASVEAPQITTAPTNPLAARQDQSQVEQLNSRIQSLIQSAQSALESVSSSSRVVSQASQQLSQSSQQLSQQSQQLSQQSQELSQSLQQATQSIDQLQQSVTAAVSSGSSAFASCTNSASSVIALASNDAANKITAAQAQATLAKTEADRQVEQAQGAAVSITQAAAAIIGTFIGSSILTVLVVWLVLRYRRQKRQSRRRERERNDNYYGSDRKRPESYNSMANREFREKDLAPVMSPESDTTKVGGLSRIGTNTTSRRMMDAVGRTDEGRNITSQSQTRRGDKTWSIITEEQPAAGEAVTVNYAHSIKRKDRDQQAPIKLSDPPPAKPKKVAKPTDENGVSEDENDKPSDSAKLSLFPKVDPSPNRVSRLSPFAKGPASAKPAKITDRPGSGGPQTPLNLQKWLQTATAVSPFGPLDGAGNNNSNNKNNSNVDNNSTKQRKPVGPGGGLPASVRLSDVKWPLQDAASGGGGPMRSDSNGSGDSSGSGPGPGTVVVKTNEAAKTVPKPSKGLPSPAARKAARKLPLRDK